MTAEVLYADLYDKYRDVSYPKYESLGNIYEVKEYLIKQYENKTNC